MILTGEPIDAARAAELGLVDRVVPAADLTAEAAAPAGRIIRRPASAVSARPAAVTRGVDLPSDEGLAVEAPRFAVTVPIEGVAVGLERFRTRTRP